MNANYRRSPPAGDVIEFTRLTAVPVQDLVELLDNPLVRRHMPLATGSWDEATCLAWVDAKDAIWNEHGYGPWAFVVHGRLLGWGGFQPEDGVPDVGLVLLPKAWGRGKEIFDEIVRRGFDEHAFPFVTALLPSSRRSDAVMVRLGFCPDGFADLEGIRFARFRRDAPRREGS